MRRSSSYCGVLLAAAFGLLAGDVSETQRRIIEAQEAQRQRALENDRTARYVPGAVVTDACKNGDFEASKRPASATEKCSIAELAGWRGAYGTVEYLAGEPDLDSLTAGILSGPLDLRCSRHTIVKVKDGPDPNVGISQVPPGGSTRAVRIGNARDGGGVELLERTFVVSADRPVIGFRYAVVLELPADHKPERRPQFRVRVTNAQGIELPDVVHLNTEVPGISDRLTAENGPPFTTLDRSPRVPVVYRPWTCAFIDLAGHAGETVTVQFIVEDCSEYGHWGYAYIDDFCADCATFPTCGSGPNLVRNGDFEGGHSDFGSELRYEPVAAPDSVLPGEYSIVDSVQARTICSCWAVNNHEPCNTTGRFLVVNGATGRAGSRRIWSQTISVVPGTAYRFCAHFRNLRQCALDVRPKVELRFGSPPDVGSPTVIHADPAEACAWQQESRRIVIPAGVTLLTAEIWLDESGEGDGNDLAVDGLSLRVEAAPEVTP